MTKLVLLFFTISIGFQALAELPASQFPETTEEQDALPVSKLTSDQSYETVQALASTSATCWVDDDPYFNQGVINAGPVIGLTQQGIEFECYKLAVSMFGANATYQLTDSKMIRISASSSLEASCYITPGSFEDSLRYVHKVYGLTTHQLRSECQKAAKAALGEYGLSLITDLSTTTARVHSLEATCTIGSSIYNTQTMGKVIGNSLQSLIKECSDMGQQAYTTTPNTALLKNVKGLSQSLNTQGISAECWIDDDYHFDYGENYVGSFSGTTTKELSDTCNELSKRYFGEESSSMIVNPTFI